MLTPKAFSGNCHVIAARFLYESELGIRRNLALNPYDGFVRKGFFPHTETNTDLQIDETFAPRNAIMHTEHLVSSHSKYLCLFL